MEARQRGSWQGDNQCRVTLQLSESDRNLLSHDAGGPDYRHLAAACCKHDPQSVFSQPGASLLRTGFGFCFVFCFFGRTGILIGTRIRVPSETIQFIPFKRHLHPGTLNSVVTTHGDASGPSRMNRMVRLGLKSHSWYQSAQFPSTMRRVCKIMSDCDVTSGVASPDTRSPYPSSATGAPCGPAAGRRCYNTGCPGPGPGSCPGPVPGTR